MRSRSSHLLVSLIIRGEALEYLGAEALEGDVVVGVVHGREGGAHASDPSDVVDLVLVKSEPLELLEVNARKRRRRRLSGKGVLGMVEDVLRLR